MWTENQNKYSWPFLLLLVGSIVTAQNHSNIQNVLDVGGQDSRAQLQPWVSTVWDAATAGGETHIWALMLGPAHWSLELDVNLCLKLSLLKIIFLTKFGPKKQQWIATILQSLFLMHTIFHDISEVNLDAKFPFP